jgi:NAD+ kinase
MKAAIYSRIMEDEQQKDVQLFFDELNKQKIEPIIFQHFF